MDSSGPPADGRRFDDALARARRHAAACAAAIEALSGVRGRASSTDGAVTAVVDGRGRLVSMEMRGNAGAPTGEMIVETTQAAAREALLRREAVLGDLLTDLGR